MGNLMATPNSPYSSPQPPPFHYDRGSNRVIDNFLKNVEENMSFEEFLSKYRTTRNYTQQIELMKPFFCSQQQQPAGQEECTQLFKKCDKISQKYSQASILSCEQENENFSLKEAEQQSNLAICYAKTQKFQSLAHASRSILLYHLKDTRGALEEMEVALAFNDGSNEDNNFETEQETEWHQLRAKYKVEMMDNDDDEKEVVKATEKVEKNKRRLFCKELFHIKSPNPMAPALDEIVDIRLNPSRGRHLVVTQDVAVGKTLLVETPFVSGLNGTLLLEHGHCHHCLKKSLRTIPCPNCVFALFCDQKCLDESKTYHKFECPCLPHLRPLLTEQNCFDGVNFHLAFKLICMLGPRKLFKIFENAQTQLLYDDNDPDGNDIELKMDFTKRNYMEIPGSCPKTGIYKSSSYHPMIHLAAEFTPEKNHFHLPLIALHLSRILEVKTQFFENIDPPRKEGFMDFVAQKILFHYTTIRINVFSIWELSGPLGAYGLTIHQSKRSRLEHDVNLFARGIFLTVSLMNHSCDPNVMVFPDLSRGRIAVVSVKPLKIGEELAIFYCPPFSEQGIELRQKRLVSGYDFQCTCVACRDQWPTMLEGLSEKRKVFCCRKCSAQLWSDMKSQECMEKILLTEENGFKCPQCRWQYSELDILNEFSRHKRALTVALRQVKGNCPLEALNRLKSAMEFFDSNVVPPYAFAVFVRKFYIEAIQFIVHFSK